MHSLLVPGPVIQLDEDLFLYDLRRLRGGLLGRIPPDTPGVYAWYRTISLPPVETAGAEEFAKALVDAATAPHCAERDARIAPAHAITLRPFQSVSPKKQAALTLYCKNKAFRSMVSRTLDMSVLFQQPLYVGKATNLAERIGQHLGAHSPLRSRLKSARIDIDQCRLLLLTLDDGSFAGLPEVDMDLDEPEEGARDEGLLPVELVMEELLSRLFLPSFTLRYGLTMPVIFSGTRPRDNYNRPLYGFHGQYTLSPGLCIPYFLTAMPVERVIDELKTAEQISPNLDNKWSLNELFQREVDRKRVERDLVRGYLADPHKLKFFNAITIVLMPKDVGVAGFESEAETSDGPAIPFDGKDPEDAPWGQEMGKKTDFGGVQYVQIGEQARLRWDVERVLAVAVDGQHRLVALQDYREDYKQKVLSQDERKTTVPVLVLLVAPQIGFKNEKNLAKQSIRAIARELFTDLNKNAKTVDNARQLVLDDLDLTARCVRELVTDETARDSKDVLPLTLIRWQDAINRFDTSYYLNSLVHLQMLVEDVLDLPTLKAMNGESVREFIRRIGVVLGTNNELTDPVAKRTLMEVYDSDYCDPEGQPQSPFMRLPAGYLDLAIDGFRKNHLPWMICALTRFTPYWHLLAYARKHNLIEGDFGKWHAQTKKHRETLKSEKTSIDQNWYKREIDDRIKAIELLKGSKDDADWSFKAIFQKAYMRLAYVVAFENKDDEKLGGIDEFIRFFDALYERGALKVRAPLDGHPFGLWAFVGISPANQKIKVTASVEQNILALLRLWYYASRKTALDARAGAASIGTPPDGAKLLAFFEKKQNQTQWPSAQTSAERLRKELSSTVLFKAAGLADAPEGGAAQKLKDEREELVARRLAAMLEAGVVFGLPAGDNHTPSPEDV